MPGGANLRNCDLARTLAEPCREVDSADTGHGFEDHDVLSLKTVSRGFSLAKDSAELIKVSFGLSQLAIRVPDLFVGAALRWLTEGLPSYSRGHWKAACTK
jgi:hypothetical protein